MVGPVSLYGCYKLDSAGTLMLNTYSIAVKTEAEVKTDTEGSVGNGLAQSSCCGNLPKVINSFQLVVQISSSGISSMLRPKDVFLMGDLLRLEPPPLFIAFCCWEALAPGPCL